MNEKKKTILNIIIFALFICVAYLAYANLSNKYEPDNKQQNISDESRQEDKNEKIKARDFIVLD